MENGCHSLEQRVNLLGTAIKCLHLEVSRNPCLLQEDQFLIFCMPGFSNWGPQHPQEMRPLALEGEQTQEKVQTESKLLGDLINCFN